LNEENYVESAKEEHVEEDSERQVEEECISYPSPISTMVTTKFP
jgi:hypothetical protein